MNSHEASFKDVLSLFSACAAAIILLELVLYEEIKDVFHLILGLD